MNRMKVGTKVVSDEYPKFGVGQIVAVQSRYQTVLVKWENAGCSYHIPWVLKEVKTGTKG